jgi:alkylmercury lyase
MHPVGQALSELAAPHVTEPIRVMALLLQRLAHGVPIPSAEAASLLGWPAHDLPDRLAALPFRVETDASGAIVSAGLTLVPTAHRFELDGQVLYTWCALDTLIFPIVLERRARVTSTCATTGAPIQLVVGPDGVSDIEPADAVISLHVPEAGDIRDMFCVHVNFHAHRPDGVEGTFLSVADGFEVARQLAARFSAAPGGCA